jgi:branched-chain amino acid transport system permease protein
LVLILASSYLERSPLGLLLRTLRADERAAEACGVGTRNLKVGALVVSAGVSAVAGSMYAVSTLVLTPDIFALSLSIYPVIFALVGGSGTLWVPVLGAGILVPLQTVITTDYGASVPGIAPLIYGGAVVIVVTLLPGGIYWELRRVVAKIAGSRLGAPAGAEMAPGSLPVAVAAPALGAALATEAGSGSGSATRALRRDPVSGSGGGDTTPVLEVAGIGKSFGGLRVLEDVTFEAREGEILGVIGPNGAGKTTLFDIITGFQRADGGSAKLAGKELLGLSAHSVCRAGVGRTFQTPRIFAGLTVGESVHVAARARGGGAAQGELVIDALRTVALKHLGRTPVEALTTGEVRRLELARAVVGWPRIVFLDEFLGGVGGEETELVLSGVREARAHGCTIVAIEHTMHAMVGFVDRFVVLNLGRVCASGSADEIGRNPEVVEAYLGHRWVGRAGS